MEDAVATPPASVASAATPPGATSAGRLLAIHAPTEGGDAAFTVAVGGGFRFETSRLASPDRFVVDLLGVVKANPRSAIEIAAGSVERVRIGQYQTEPEPIARLVFDLRQDQEPVIERGDSGLTVRF